MEEIKFKTLIGIKLAQDYVYKLKADITRQQSEIRELRKRCDEHLLFANELIERKRDKGEIIKVATDKQNVICFVANYRDKDLNLFVAKSLSRAGYLEYEINEKGKTVHIGNLCVDERFRNQGRGTILLEALIDIAKKQNIREITGSLSWVDEKTIEAKELRDGFYRARGFIFDEDRIVLNLK